MIKLKHLVGLPSLQYHLDNELTLHENVYRYSSEAFVQLFAEARTAHRDGTIQLNEQDKELLETTDIGECGNFQGKKVPLDLPMINESYDYDEVAQSEFGMDYDQLGPGEKEWVRDEIDNMLNEEELEEAEYQGKDVDLNKPKRGGSKKFYVYVKDPKTKNIRKVSFGAKDGGGNLAVKLKDPKARKAFADRHDCKNKKDKTKPSYWSCRVGRYWKSLGGSQNYAGYW